MPNHKGVVEIQDNSHNPTIILDGETGDVSAGGSGQDGLLVAADGAGNDRVRVDGATGSVEIVSPTGDPVVRVDGEEGDVVIFRMVGGSNREVLRFDASTGALTIGSEDVEGDLVVKDQNGRTVLRFDGSSSALYLGAEGNEGDILVRNNTGDNSFQVDGNSGNIWVRRREGRTLRNVLHFDAVHAALHIGSEGNEGDLLIRDGDGRNVFHFDSNYAALYLGADGNEGDLIIRDGEGRNAFHLDSNRAALYVGTDGNEGDIIVRDGSGRNVFHFDSNRAALYLGADGNEGDLIIRDGQGRDVFRFDSTYAVLDVGGAGNEGDIRVRDNDGDVRIHLDGNSGDIKLLGADFAEDFEVASSQEMEDGTVLVINDEGTLQPSTRAYDSRVAGIISGAGGYRPGLILDRKPGQGPDGRSTTPPSGRRPVALTGKVYCWVDADYGQVGVGDLLTTSETRGHAMRVADPRRAFGAVIGKALGKLPEGRGLVPVLVALQ